MKEILARAKSLMFAKKQEPQWDCREWMINLRSKMVVACGILSDLNQFTAMAVLLTERGYTKSEAQRAEEWILTGNWKAYRGVNPQLELRDFYPTLDQLPMKKTEPALTWEQRQLILSSRLRQGSKYFHPEVAQFIEYDLATSEDFTESGQAEAYDPQTKQHTSETIYKYK